MMTSMLCLGRDFKQDGPFYAIHFTQYTNLYSHQALLISLPNPNSSKICTLREWHDKYLHNKSSIQVQWTKIMICSAKVRLSANNKESPANSRPCACVCVRETDGTQGRHTKSEKIYKRGRTFIKLKIHTGKRNKQTKKRILLMVTTRAGWP